KRSSRHTGETRRPGPLITKGKTNMKAYLIIDIGTGNVRVALVETTGGLLWVGRDDVHYREDGKTEDALYFEPDLLWGQIVTLIKAALLENRGVDIVAITS